MWFGHLDMAHSHGDKRCKSIYLPFGRLFMILHVFLYDWKNLYWSTHWSSYDLFTWSISTMNSFITSEVTNDIVDVLWLHLCSWCEVKYLWYHWRNRKCRMKAKTMHSKLAVYENKSSYSINSRCMCYRIWQSVVHILKWTE